MVCGFHNRHIPSACILLHLPVPATLSFPLCYKHLLVFNLSTALRTAKMNKKKIPDRLFLGLLRLCPVTFSDLPAWRVAGCWATVLLLAFCPMLGPLPPPAGQVLPHLRPHGRREEPYSNSLLSKAHQTTVTTVLTAHSRRLVSLGCRVQHLPLSSA